jgi:hypothetical protein
MNSLPACIPVGRMGEVGEIVDAILYLERAKFVTGETLTVDGGQHAGPGGKSHLSPRDTRLKLWPGRHDACYQARDIVQQFCVGISALAAYVARRCLRKTKPASFKNKQNTLIKTNMKSILLIQSSPRGSESYREKLPIRSLTIFKRVIPGQKWLSAMWRKIRRRMPGAFMLRQSSHHGLQDIRISI